MEQQAGMVLKQVQVGPRIDAREEEFRMGYMFQDVAPVQLGTRIDVMEEEARIVHVQVAVKSDAMEGGPSDSDRVRISDATDVTRRKQQRGPVVEHKSTENGGVAVKMFISNENLKHLETLEGKRRSLVGDTDKVWNNFEDSFKELLTNILSGVVYNVMCGFTLIILFQCSPAIIYSCLMMTAYWLVMMIRLSSAVIRVRRMEWSVKQCTLLESNFNEEVESFMQQAKHPETETLDKKDMTQIPSWLSTENVKIPNWFDPKKTVLGIPMHLFNPSTICNHIFIAAGVLVFMLGISIPILFYLLNCTKRPAQSSSALSYFLSSAISSSAQLLQPCNMSTVFDHTGMIKDL